jgi:hypothetical protein
MVFRSFSLVGIALACLALTTAAKAQTASIDFVKPVSEGTQITVKGTVNDTLLIAVAPAALTAPDCNKFAQAPLAKAQIVPDQSKPAVDSLVLDVSPKTITLSSALNKGDQVCLRLNHTDAGQVTSVYSQAVTVMPSITTLSFTNPPTAASKLVKLTLGAAKADFPADLFIYDFARDYTTALPTGLCSQADLDSKKGTLLAIGKTQETSQSLTDSNEQSVELYRALGSDDQLCLIAYSKAATPPVFSLLTRVVPQGMGTIKFTTDVIAGISTFSFQSDTSGDVSVYSFGAGFKGKNGTICSDDDRQHGVPVTMVGNSANATVTSVPVTANVQQTVSLTVPPNAGTQICLFESTGMGIPNSAFSELKPVNFFAPGSDYGRFTINFIGGAMISNQQQSTNSSTASQYLDVAFGYTLARSGSREKVPYRFTKYRGPGIQTFLDTRLATIPVTSTNDNLQTAVPGQPGSTTPTLTQTLNALSSQQSIRVLAGVYAPFRLTHWYSQTNWVTLAPIGVAGFDTLLNPTAPAAQPSSLTVISTTTANFSSVYNYRAAGARLGWDVYSDSTDEAPHNLAWISATLGNYSNLPSYVCTATKAQINSIPTGAKSFSDTTAPQTDCLIKPSPTSTTTPPYAVYATRKLIPRIDASSELSLPTLPIVIGMDANLSQYWIDANHLDTQNRPGNDVRIYIGLRLDITKALSKLGVSPAQ